jgi:hypothetical protein
VYPIRPFQENDRDAVRAMGVSILDDPAPHTSLHLVAGDAVVGDGIAGHAQAVDRRATPSVGPGPSRCASPWPRDTDGKASAVGSTNGCWPSLRNYKRTPSAPPTSNTVPTNPPGSS